MKMFLLFSHKLTKDQEKGAAEQYGVGVFVELPAELQAAWSAVPPEGPLPIEHLRPVLDWVVSRATPGDVVLVQGDAGATVYAVSVLRRAGLVPVYATTARIQHEEKQPDGAVKKVSVFQHVCFREYVQEG